LRDGVTLTTEETKGDLDIQKTKGLKGKKERVEFKEGSQKPTKGAKSSTVDQCQAGLILSLQEKERTGSRSREGPKKTAVRFLGHCSQRTRAEAEAV